MLASLTARLAAHGLTLTAERHETHGYVSQWRLDGLGAPARFGTIEAVAAWAERWVEDSVTHPRRALDLFCCAGGATKGLQLAGYHVTGVDNRPQPRYVGDVFHQDDAMAWLRGEREPLASFDLIWASPPCQRYSKSTPAQYKETHPDLLPPVADLLRAQSVPYIIENVHGAQHMMRNPVFLCGSMFGLNIWRHRWFEVGNANVFFLLPPCNHQGVPVLISGTHRRGGRRWDDGHGVKSAAIEIDWMITKELDEAIPPAYSRFLAEQIATALARQEAA